MSGERLNQTIDWLYSLEARGEIYKLERMETALKVLGNPHRRLTAVHIAGTKGKGSVAAMLDAMLRAAGYRTGLYTKPHLVRLAERTRINGAEIAPSRLLEYIERLRAVFDRAGMALTFFEFTVAMMFLYFAEEQVDIAVIETGLGGRLDSTNVVTPILSVITPIGFDHVEILGHTIRAIASEKGGIIKPGVPVVIGTRDPEARATLTSIAAQRRSPVFMIDREFSYRSRAPEHALDYQGLGLDLPELGIGLAGPFQQENAAIAVAAAEVLSGGTGNYQTKPNAELSFETKEIRISEDNIRQGLREVSWPGRFDIVSRRPTVILDCAHNEMSIAALLETLALELGPGVRPRLVFGCLADKQFERMAAMLAPRIKDVVVTRVSGLDLGPNVRKRPADVEDLARQFAPHVPVRVERDPLRAIDLAIASAAPEDVVLATGSVYLIGEIYPYFLAREGRGGLFPEAAP